MAKIYETEQDLKRDVAANEPAHHAEMKRAEYSLAAAHAFAASGFADAAQLAKRNADLEKRAMTLSEKSNKYIAAFAAAAAATFLFFGFKSRDNEKAAEAKLEALGPEHVILPSEAAHYSDAAHQAKAAHAIHSSAHHFNETTHVVHNGAHHPSETTHASHNGAHHPSETAQVTHVEQSAAHGHTPAHRAP